MRNACINFCAMYNNDVILIPQNHNKSVMEIQWKLKSTFAPRDEIWPTDLTPWIGFVYTYPKYRGRRNAGFILDYCECIATVMGKENVYISTDHIGLYEKYGYEFLNMQPTPSGEEARVYYKPLQKDSAEKESRMEKGGKWKAEIVAYAKKSLSKTMLF